MKKWLEAAAGVILGVMVLALLVNFKNGNQYKSFVVQSGSMEPTIRIGDVIVVKGQSGYQKGEVVTFETKAGKVVTHRIFAQDKESLGKYVTKGDANRSEDNDVINKDQIIGKVVGVIPKVGYLANFIRTGTGFVSLILVPSSIILIIEMGFLLKK